MSNRAALLLMLCLTAACSAPVPGTDAQPAATPAAGLTPFASEAEFETLLAAWRKRAQAEARRRIGMSATADSAAPPMPAPAAAEAVSAPAAESITNVQTAGVDEGGIVKRHGDHLVVLRRGRLFTIRIGGDALQPVATVDAFGPDTNPGGSWYDEMLVGGDTVVVIGYSYARGGTELVLFDIDRDGGLRYRDTWQLRGNDYYSARNYASRLVGDTLVFYSPVYLGRHQQDDSILPGLRRWSGAQAPEDFRPILPATRIYRSDAPLDPFASGVALHTVTRCDLSGRDLDCSATAVLGPPGRVFYVSADSVYVWTSTGARGQPDPSAVFRIPLDGTTPSAMKARGMPVDQLSFLHDGSGHLNVLLSDTGAGEGMWGDETSSGGLALLRVSLSDFADGSTAAPESAYRRLPGTAAGAMQNRFVGDWLLYGSAPFRWQRELLDDPPGSTAHALRYAGDGPVHALSLGHGAERIEAMGGDAIIVGSAGGDLHFTSVALGDQAAARGVHVQPDAAQGESRSHGFFYRAEGAGRGIVGLPVVSRRRGNDMGRYLDDSAAVLYLRNQELRFTPMGALAAHPERAVDDGCRASCVDWYGNARPIFIGERVFALLGYELVEGRVADGHIVERRRASFAPVAAAGG